MAGEEEMTTLDKLSEFAKKYKWGLIVLLVVAIIFGVVQMKSSSDAALRNQEEVLGLAEASANASDSVSVDPGVDEQLMQQQSNLTEKYGTAPDNFIWDTDGSLLSLGDTDMSPEDVLYTYLRAATTLDFDVVQMFTKRSSVYNTYSGYFDSSSTNTDASDKFDRDMYREMLTTMQVDTIADTSRFSDNRRVYTVKARILDLTDKNFWQDDYDTIMDTLYTYNSVESDSSKGYEYLYNYVLDHYKSSDAQYRDVTFDITLVKVTSWNSGWLVSIDEDLNNYLENTDGTQVVSAIMSEYRQYAAERVSGD